MCIDKNGRLYGWGDGRGGCLGFGDAKKRLSVCPLTFFEDKRCIDVSCGDKFTVVIAEVFHSLNDGEDSDGSDFETAEMRMKKMK
jgi:hypothetical protein